MKVGIGTSKMNVNNYEPYVSMVKLWRLGVMGAWVLINVLVVAHYFDLIVTISYIIGVAILFAGVAWISDRCSPAIIRWLVLSGVLSTTLLQIWLLWQLAPHFDMRMDRDTALTMWLSRLARGNFPYLGPTDIGNPISVFPFMPMIALPFVLLGNVGYLEIFSYLCLVMLLRMHYRHSPRDYLLAIAALSTSPLLFMEVVGRSDLIANMTLAMYLIWWLQSYEQQSRAQQLNLLAVGMGFLAATRIALYPILAVIVLFLWKRLDRKNLARVLVISILVSGIIILPFLFWDLHTFLYYAPLGVNGDKLGTNTLMQAFWLALMGLVVFVSGWVPKHAQALPALVVLVMSVVIMATWTTFSVDYTYLQLVFIPVLFSLNAVSQVAVYG